MIVNPQPEDCSRCTHTLCMTLAEDTIYNVQERLCADVKDVVGAATLKPDFRSAFIVRRLLVFCVADILWSFVFATAAFIKFVKMGKTALKKMTN